MTTPLKSFLRKCGLWSHRKATIQDVASADTENAARENEQAFREITDVYQQQVSQAQDSLKNSLEKAAAPFADLETLMREMRDSERRLRRDRKERNLSHD